MLRPPRERELAQLADLIDRTRGKTVYLVGPPGTGKNALVRDLVRNHPKRYQGVIEVSVEATAFTSLDELITNHLASVMALPPSAVFRQLRNMPRPYIVVLDELNPARDYRLPGSNSLPAEGIIPIVISNWPLRSPEERTLVLHERGAPIARDDATLHRDDDIDVVLTFDGDRVVVAPAIAGAQVSLIDPGGQILKTVPYLICSAIPARYRRQIEDFEKLINDADTSEQQFQNFFERHPRFLLGHEYERALPQVVLERDDDGPLRPDFLLKPIGKSLADVLDLKLPGEKLVVGSKNRRRPSHAVQDAVAQMREYRDYFERPEHRQALLAKIGVTAHRPRATIVIGKRTDEENEERQKQIEDALPSYVRIVTYDDLLQQMKHLAAPYR